MLEFQRFPVRDWRHHFTLTTRHIYG